MSFLVDPVTDYKTWDYMIGNPDFSLSKERYFHLLDLAYLSDWTMKLAFRDLTSDNWSKWMTFDKLSHNSLFNGYDIHRSLMEYEVVVESDYADYEDNVSASRLIGKILESKGFSPMYYYSGNKSIHTHIILDKEVFSEIPMKLQLEVMEKTKKAYLFKRRFMEWLRAKIISMWDLNIKQFDDSLVKSTHLIRSELSRNKLGFKTFLGYSYKDITTIPYICNEKNHIQPQIGKIRLSKPTNFTSIMEEFIWELDLKRAKKKRRNNQSLSNFGVKQGLRPEVKFILSDEFKETDDGYHRAMFILCNELDNIDRIKDWRDRMEFPLKDSEIEYRFKNRHYTLSTSFLDNFLESIGFSKEQWLNKGKI